MASRPPDTDTGANPLAVSHESAIAALGSVPKAPATTFGTADLRIAQATVADLRVVKDALQERPERTDLTGTLATVGAALGIAWRILRDSNGNWQVPKDGKDVLVLVIAAISGTTALFKFLKAFRPQKLNVRAQKLVDEMIAQVGKQDEAGDEPAWLRTWHWFLKIL